MDLNIVFFSYYYFNLEIVVVESNDKLLARIIANLMT